jgi:hypothetical protein
MITSCRSRLVLLVFLRAAVYAQDSPLFTKTDP